mgnify:CR=1 FL=1
MKNRAPGPPAAHKPKGPPELLFTFGLAYLVDEAVHLVWGRAAVEYRIPASLDGPLFQVFTSEYPTYRVFMMLVSVAISFSAIGLLRESLALALDAQKHLRDDLRLLVIGRRVLAMKRINHADWRTNVARGAATEPLEPSDEMIAIWQKWCASYPIRSIEDGLALIEDLGEATVVEGGAPAGRARGQAAGPWRPAAAAERDWQLCDPQLGE